jgi:hypothetical protein
MAAGEVPDDLLDALGLAVANHVRDNRLTLHPERMHDSDVRVRAGRNDVQTMRSSAIPATTRRVSARSMSVLCQPMRQPTGMRAMPMKMRVVLVMVVLSLWCSHGGKLSLSE